MQDSRLRTKETSMKNSFRTAFLLMAIIFLTYLFRVSFKDTSGIGNLKDRMLLFLIFVELVFAFSFLLSGSVKWFFLSVDKRRQNKAVEPKTVDHRYRSFSLPPLPLPPQPSTQANLPEPPTLSPSPSIGKELVLYKRGTTDIVIKGFWGAPIGDGGTSLSLKGRGLLANRFSQED